MNIAIVGCGFVSAYYMQTMQIHPQLRLVGAYDRDSLRLSNFTRRYAMRGYRSLDELCQDRDVDLVLNLTSTSSHFDVSRVSLEHGKHVYTEKPITLCHAHAEQLVSLASEKGCIFSSAPCSLLGSTAQTLWRALRANRVGQPYLVYAEMDDGMIHRMPYRNWQNADGVPWPAHEEFESGCTLEHAGYYVAWLAAFFGPVRRVHAFASVVIPDKQSDEPLTKHAPDFSVACLEFDHGLVARLTCSIVAPRDHQLRIIGEDGILATRDCWHYHSPVYVRRRLNIRNRTIMHPWPRREKLWGAGKLGFRMKGAQQMDFCRGLVDIADAVATGRSPYLASDYCLHVNEVVLAIQNAGDQGAIYDVRTEFQPLQPLTDRGTR
ncbi:MAG: Gfo/Idh/MocA family oxidoreductase [Planctomycetales bacterium]|nr:Gfo/Idh/MocA family oxidoreductase [Planctomycetales bacterium]